MEIIVAMWCRSRGSDKVWGAVRLTSDQMMYFWGRRGSKLRTSVVNESRFQVIERARTKLNESYHCLDNLSAVYPEFETDIRRAATWAMLAV